MRRVVVTGIGCVSPLGLNIESTWQALLESKTGVAPITRFDASKMPVQVACEVKGFDPLLYVEAKEVRRTDLYELYAIAASKQAVQAANLCITWLCLRLRKTACGCSIWVCGSCIAYP